MYLAMGNVVWMFAILSEAGDALVFGGLGEKLMQIS